MKSGAAPQSQLDEDFLRARFYGLLATLLASPPDGDLLGRLAHLQTDATPLGKALGTLGAAARADTTDVDDEFATLFIGVTGGELTPYASWYLTGFLHEKPLAELRDDMVRLGIEPSPTTAEPEDHAASLCEMMQGLITGLFGAPCPTAEQKRFFSRHLGSWLPQFFTDLEDCPSVTFYRAVGTLGRVFLEIESQAFAMVD